MEQQLTRPRPGPSSGSGSDNGDGDGLDVLRAQDILAAADRILDSIKPINAQAYLEQNQQRGGE